MHERVCYYNNGASFGELAISHNNCRKATAIVNKTSIMITIS